MNESNEVEINPYASPQTPVSVGSLWVESGGPSLRKVALGISLIYYGILLVLLAIIVIVMAAILAHAAGNPTVRWVGALMAIGMIVVAAILNFLGPIICLAVPAKRCKSFIRGAVICQLLNLAIGIGVQIVQRLEGTPGFGLIPTKQGGNNIDNQLVRLSDLDLFLMAAQLFSNVIGCIAFILFILFLKRLAQFIDRQDLSQRASSVLNTWIFFIIFLIAVSVLLVLETLGGLLILIPVLIAGIAVLIMYVKLIESMKKAMTSQAQGTL